MRVRSQWRAQALICVHKKRYFSVIFVFTISTTSGVTVTSWAFTACSATFSKQVFRGVGGYLVVTVEAEIGAGYMFHRYAPS